MPKGGKCEMQKIKESVLNHMLKSNMTSAEVNFIIYISHFQDDTGKVVGIHYKDICNAIDVSYQTFYDVVKNLEKKNIIKTDRTLRDYPGEWTIQILNNDFTGYCDQEKKESYISTGHDIFYKKAFLQLKAKEKLLAMHLIKIAGANQTKVKDGLGKFHIGVKKFYEEYSRLLGVTERVLQKYLTSLKEFFYIGIKNRNYWMTPRTDIYKDKAPGDMSQIKKHVRNIICRRNKIVAPYHWDELKDTVELLHQYKEQPDLVSKLLKAVSKSFQKGEVEESVKAIKQEKTRKLSPSFVHKLLCEELAT